MRMNVMQADTVHGLLRCCRCVSTALVHLWGQTRHSTGSRIIITITMMMMMMMMMMIVMMMMLMIMIIWVDFMWHEQCVDLYPPSAAVLTSSTVSVPMTTVGWV